MLRVIQCQLEHQAEASAAVGRPPICESGERKNGIQLPIFHLSLQAFHLASKFTCFLPHDVCSKLATEAHLEEKHKYLGCALRRTANRGLGAHIGPFG